MATPFEWIGLGVTAIFGLVGASQSSQAQADADAAQAAAEEAQEAQWQTELETHQFNIDIARKGLREGTADISREGARSLRLQGAAMGASGATLGTGTPLMNMISTAAGIERDKSRLAAEAQLEIDFRQGEIEGLEQLLGIGGEEIETAFGAMGPTTQAMVEARKSKNQKKNT